MNTYNFNDPIFRESALYRDYLNENPTTGYLRIRAYAASQAIPISNLKITVSRVVDNNRIIFFEGNTNESGIIERIELPTPRLDPNNLDVPSRATYEINASYEPDNVSRVYLVNLYENVYVVQTINIVPTTNNGVGGL